MRIAFFGDIVGKIGICGLRKYLSNNRFDLVIANGENANEEHGLTIDNYNELLSIGVDCITNGNHFFETEDIFTYEGEYHYAIRPANFSEDAPGNGSILLYRNDYAIRITNLIGRVFINMGQENPFSTLSQIIQKDDADIHIVDIHAETTYEKRCLAEFFDGKVTAVVGTHTHVQTNDLQLLPKGTLFITDVGMNGAKDSVIGDIKDDCIKKTMLGEEIILRVPVCGDKQINAIWFEYDEKMHRISNYGLINSIVEG